MIDAAGIARVLHVLGVVVWIGGVGLVTTVVLPAVKSWPEVGERLALLEAIERRFSWIARAMVLIVGLSGLYMVSVFGLWSRFAQPGFWWMHAMVAVWTIFAVLLFVLEPLLKRKFSGAMLAAQALMLRRMTRMHWLLFAASIVAIAGAVAGAHGYALFG